MHHKLLYLTIFAFFVMATADEVGRSTADITTDTTATESTTDETTTTESTTDETTTTESATEGTTTTESATEGTTTTEGTTEETTVSSSATTKDDENSFQVYFVNDLHYHILPLDDKLQPCASGNCFGGLARLQAKLLDVAKKSKLLLINAGHSFDKELFNAFGFSAFEEAAKILEFSAQLPSEDLYRFGLGAALKYSSSEDKNMVCANVKPIKSQQLVTIHDCKISVIGYVEKARIESLNLTELTADEEKTAVENEVTKAKGDITIVVGSSSLEKAKEIAKIEGVDVVLVSGAETGSKDVWEQIGNGAYVGSLYVDDTNIDTIFKIGEITFTLDDKCNVQTVGRDNILYKEDPVDDNTTAVIKPYLDRLSVVTTADVLLNCSGAVCSKSECAAGSLVADAIVMFLAKDGDATTPKLALVPGRIFSDLIIKGDVKGSDLYRMLDNFYLCSATVKGSFLKQILETSVADYKGSETPMEKYLQISGFFRVIYNLKNGVGHRVEELQVFSSQSEEWKFEDVSDDEDYNVVIPADLWEKTPEFNVFLDPTFLDVTMLDALHYYLSITGNRPLVPPLGERVQYKQGSSGPKVECYNNTGEVIILTLLVVGILSGLGIFLWKYIYPRYRARRGSTIQLIS